MADSKSKNIQFFGHQITIIEEDIERLKGLKTLPFAKLTMYNGSGKFIEINISNDFRKELHEVYLERLDNEKAIIYKNIAEELKKIKL